ncbi:MAG: hypothetical protein CM1200mP23_0360 [Nitrososphaerota archaeon]|nr:MAG: hypothetical protein CM1200mP23_0360 [Nitrososphaerota archaeon]
MEEKIKNFLDEDKFKKREPKKRYVLPGDFITTAPLRLQNNVV